jgi:hypothetical protein
MGPFILSIEPVAGPTYRHGFHLGTDEAVARQIAEETYRSLRRHPGTVCAVRTVALIRDERLVDVFDGRWDSSYWWNLDEEGA